MLTLWRPKPATKDEILLDLTPTGKEEEDNLYGSGGVSDPRDLNEMVIRERLQDMSERIFYADRAFLMACLWVGFIIILTLIQMLMSIWDNGLTDAQFVTVVTTTTASVFGFWMLVGRYLHRAPPKD